MKETPIIFSTDMVKAIIEGRKTQTRRVINLPSYHPSLKHKQSWTIKEWKVYDGNGDLEGNLRFPYGMQGDMLWVRETFTATVEAFYYKANGQPFDELDLPWKPSIHMPKDAARIWLEITDIRVERLQEISYHDAKAEGIEPIGENCEGATLFRNYENPPDYIAEGELSTRLSFRSLWDSINDKPDKNWNANPWVWVVSFKVLSTTGKPNQFQQLEKEYRNGC